jgi:PPM family protein phosphatase
MRSVLHYTTAIATECAGSRNEDRAAVIQVDSGCVIVVSDGAGGISGGNVAAEATVQFVRDCVSRSGAVVEPEYWCRALTALDLLLSSESSAGECTVVVAVLDQAGVRGASIGDSGALMIADSEFTDLTASQKRKPLCGSGAAVPTPFGPTPLRGTLVLASDGLLKYAKPSLIKQAASRSDVDDAARTLVDSARLPTGKLQDDIVVVVCR